VEIDNIEYEILYEVNNIFILNKHGDVGFCDICENQCIKGFTIVLKFNPNTLIKVDKDCLSSLVGDEGNDIVNKLYNRFYGEFVLDLKKIDWLDAENEYRQSLDKFIMIDTQDKEDFNGDKVVGSRLTNSAKVFLDKAKAGKFSQDDEEHILQYINLFGNPKEVITKCRNLAIAENKGLLKSEFFRDIYIKSRTRKLTKNQIAPILETDINKVFGIDTSEGNGVESFDETKKFISNLVSYINSGMNMVESKFNKLTLNIMRTVLGKNRNISEKQLSSIYLFVDRNKDNIFGFLKTKNYPRENIDELKEFISKYSYIKK